MKPSRHPDATCLAPIEEEAWPPLIEHLKGGFAGRLNIYRVMAHDAPLLKAWAALRDHVVLQSALTPAQRELVILRVGFRWRAAYEWAHHVSRAREAGVQDERIAAACEPVESLRDDNPDKPFIAAVDRLLAKGNLDRASLALLVPLVGKEGVIDLMATVGMYTTLAFLAKSFEVPIEDEFLTLAPSW